MAASLLLHVLKQAMMRIALRSRIHWAAPGQAKEVVLKTTWKDAGTWGLMLADVARHAANAYENEGHDRVEVLARIRQSFEAEFSDPTDQPKQI